MALTFTHAIHTLWWEADKETIVRIVRSTWMRYFLNFLNMLIGLMIRKLTFFEKKSLRNIDFSDLVTKDFELFTDRNTMAGDFRSFSSTEDYNRDFLNIFQAFKKDFYLDYSQKDGHFRV